MTHLVWGRRVLQGRCLILDGLRVPCSRSREHVSFIREICVIRGEILYGQYSGASVSRSARRHPDPHVFVVFLCAAAPLRESIAFIWGYACVPKYEDCL